MARHIDADALREKMYHKAFEEDSPDQKWDSGCWIRYHMFEDTIESTPTADAVERKDLDEIIEGHEEIGYEKGYRDGYAQAMEEAIQAVGVNTWAGSRITQLKPAKFTKGEEN